MPIPERSDRIRGTTILAVRHKDKVVIAGDGQVSIGQTVVKRAAVELAKDWRSDRVLRRLEALLIVADREASLLVTGSGDVIEPDDGILAVGSGGNFALAAARALVAHSTLEARAIAEEAMKQAAALCVYTNEAIVVEELAE